MIKYILMLMITLLFSGCFWCQPVVETKVVYKDKVILVAPPKEVLSDVSIPKPPDKELFIQSGSIDRLNMLTKYSISLMKRLNSSNNKFRSLREWVDKQKKIYKADK